MNRLVLSLLAVCALSANAAYAQTAGKTQSAAPAKGVNAEDLAKSKGCIACHGIDKKIVGPAYKDVAAKYKGDPKAEAHLIEKVKKGGKGVWGEVPMPPNNVTDAEAKTLVQWVLSQK